MKRSFVCAFVGFVVLFLPCCKTQSEGETGKYLSPGLWMEVQTPGEIPSTDSVAEVALVQMWQPTVGSAPILLTDTLRSNHDRGLAPLVREVWTHDSLRIRITQEVVNREPLLKAWLGPNQDKDTVALCMWIQWAGSHTAFLHWQRKWAEAQSKRLRLSRYLLDSVSLRGPWTAQTEDALLANRSSGSGIRPTKGHEVEIEYRLLAINQHPVPTQPSIVQTLCMGTPDQVLPGFAWALSFLSEGDHATLHLGVNQTNGLLPGHDLLAPNHKTLTFAIHVKKIHPSTCL